MATCKDCIHREACMKFNKVRVEVLEKTASRGADELCDTFADKSRFIELPCKVGDTVYRVSFVRKNIIPLQVEGFLCNLASWKVRCTHLIPSWIGNQKEHIYISFSSFGKTVFLTNEEAEAAIAERSKE